MSKSLRAKAISTYFRFHSFLDEKHCRKKLEKNTKTKEKYSRPPIGLKTRIEDSENGRVFYLNEKDEYQPIIFYIHGGAYQFDFLWAHWLFIRKLIKRTHAKVIAPGYRLVPYATYQEAFDLIVPIYKYYTEKYPKNKIVCMGDSAGGGLSLALMEYFKKEKMRMPDECILLSPWVDISMENEDIQNYIDKDPLIHIDPLNENARLWASDLDVHHWKVSPLYGDVQGLQNITIFTGTDEVLYPDIQRLFISLKSEETNELIIGQSMNHDYPLYPIPEAREALDIIVSKINR